MRSARVIPYSLSGVYVCWIHHNLENIQVVISLPLELSAITIGDKELDSIK